MARSKMEIPTPFCFRSNITVTVSDLNYGAHVGNERYLLFAQETRIRFLQTLGCSEMKFGDFGLILTEARVEYLSELFRGEELTISLAVSAPSRAGFECYYEIAVFRNGKHVTAARLMTVMVCFDYQERKVRGIPDHLAVILNRLAQGLPIG
jgi:acyl-CoA thioesterase FadM